MTGSTVDMLICVLAMLTGILIGKKYREWKKGKNMPKAKSLKDAMNVKNRRKEKEL